ncbi:MAG: hypothetical protein ABEJ93_03740 [Candidatus Nanohalobium sp.]
MERKGQFMFVSAIIVSLIILSLSATMKEVKTKTYEPLDQGHHIASIRDAGQELDLAKKSDRAKFKEMVNSINSYSSKLEYWEERRCYNVTLTNPDTRLFIKCAGDGSIFHDGFEDGDMRDPAWIKHQMNGEAKVERLYSPTEQSYSLKVSEEGTVDTANTVIWEKNADFWSKSWVAEGLFQIKNMNKSVPQRHSIVLYSGSSRKKELQLFMGVRDPKLKGSSTKPLYGLRNDTVTNTNNPDNFKNWNRSIWYEWKMFHYARPGKDRIRVRIFEDYPRGVKGYDSLIRLSSIPSGTGAIGIKVNSTQDKELTVLHDYVQVREME